MNRRKVVITGGAGFIGSHLAAKLAELGDDVHVIDDLSSGDRSRVPSQACLHVFDLRDVSLLREAMAGAEVVFHLGAVSSVALSFERPVHVHSVNALGTVAVLDAARRCSVRRVVYSSSSAVYGDLAAPVLSEDMPAVPISPYGLSKHEGEHAARLFHRLYGLETVSLRYFNVYGPGQDPSGPYAAVIPRFRAAQRAGKPLPIIGDGLQTRDFIMVDDVVRANVQAAVSSDAGRGDAVNIGSGGATTIMDLATMIGGELAFLPPRREIRHSCADVECAASLLGFRAKVSLAEGLRRMQILS